MITTKRAKRGGEFGANGEWYEGGKFINTIPENRKKEGSQRRGTGKQEIAPYTWEVSSEGKLSLYRQFAGVFGKVIDGVAVLMCSEQTLRYFRTSREEAQNLIDRWNAGERWL
jgi:hypothetical protein